MKNDRILFISDLHTPYHHQDAVAFLATIKKKYKPTRIINVGDEVDYHALSFHPSNPDLDSAGVELSRAKASIQELARLFPKMDLVHSNHGSMIYRKAKVSGMPRHALKSYNEVLGVDEDWKWHMNITLPQKYGKDIYVTHGSRKNSETYAKQMGCNVVQGHYHEDFRIGYHNTPSGLIWGMNVGCLIDDDSMAFEYNKVNPFKPILGCGFVDKGRPSLIPMMVDGKGNWDGRV